MECCFRDCLSDMGDEVSMLEIVKESIDFPWVIDGGIGILDKGAELEVIAESLFVLEEILSVTLGWVVQDHDSGGNVKGRVGIEEDVLQGAVAVAISGSNKPKERTTLGEHFGAREQAMDRGGHASKLDGHEFSEIVRGEWASGKAAFPTMLGTEAPEWMDVKSVIHAEASKLGVPGMDASMGVIITGKRVLYDVLVISDVRMYEQCTVGKDKLVKTFNVIKVS